MKRIFPILMTVLIAGASMTFTSCKKEKENVEPTTNNPVVTLTAYEQQSLTFTREEEKMARDVYAKLYAKWTSMNFLSNIMDSEQKHMDAILNLLNTYGITDPAAGKAEGDFTSTDIQKLYDDLTAKGLMSEMDALIVGMTIEDVDIYDLQQALKQVEKDDIKQVYNNLKKASQNHMREFYAQLTAKGGTYTPQYITQEEFDYIISTPKQHGSQ